jgi:hypothetical protein
LDSMFGNITTEETGERLLQGISRTDGRTTTLVIRNDGNVPLSAVLSTDLLDKDGELRTDWTIRLEPNTITGLGVGDEQRIELTLTPKDNVARGIGLLQINLSSDGLLIAQFDLEVSVATASGSTGLFSVLPPAVSIGLVAVLLVGAVVLARRMKQSGTLADDSADLVAPDTHGDPDTLGLRRGEALDLGTAVDELTSGEVSDEEIARAIMQSIDVPVIPAAVPTGLPPSGLPPKVVVPMGLPPAGMPPAGLPTPKALPPLPQPAPPAATTPLPATTPSVLPEPVSVAPPVPAAGLPPGWTMEQWQHYGHEWLRRQG